jgi:SAM-dependent methyltransferase
MTNLDLYAKAEHLLGIEDATKELHNLYKSELEDYDIKTLLDIGCGRGGFMKLMQKKGVECKGIDLSSVMVDECRAQGLDAQCCDISEVDGTFDAIVAIFDVLNFMDEKALIEFLEAASIKLNNDGVLIADINTLYGFSEVAEGAMSNDSENEFLNVDAKFKNNQLETKFTLFVKEDDGKYSKYQDSIVQYFHKIKLFQKLQGLKLIEKHTFSLYETEDKTLLILKKR